MTVQVKSNPKRHRLANGRHGGWVPSRPAPSQDWPLSKKLGDLPNATPSGVVALADPQCFPRIRNQGSQGSCGGHSARSMLYYCFARKHGEKIAGKWGQKWDLSPAGIYFRAREKDSSVNEDSGVWNRLLWDAIREHGAPTEESCPYNARVLTTRLSTKAVQTGKWHQTTAKTYRCDEDGNREKTVDRMLQALAADMPLQIGFTCFTNLDAADDTGAVPLPGRADRDDGGHDVGSFWADTRARVFWGPNSWANQWGGRALEGARFDERGYIGLPFDYVLRGYADDIWAVDIE